MRLLSSDEGHEDFWPAYTDILMVTSLVLILLAVTFALVRQDTRIQEELKRRKQSFALVFESVMHNEIKKGHLHLANPKEGERQVISFSDTLLFEKGEAKLDRPIGLQSLKKVSQLLAPCLKEGKFFQAIQVNGHTDPDPIVTPQYPSNWHLSSARATSVLYFLIQNKVRPESITATGFAHYSPVDANGNRITDKSRMRRIEIVLQYPQDWIGKQLDASQEHRIVK